MEDKKISELDPGISSASNTDFVQILDGSERETKKLQKRSTHIPLQQISKVI